MIFGEIDSALNLVEKFKKYFSLSKRSVELESVATRFIHLFEAHGVHRNQIPRFFGHEISLKDLQDSSSLTIKLDEEILEDVCKLFAVRREWLDGADKQVHLNHDFYKKPKEFLKFITNLKLINPEGQLDGELFVPDNSDFNAEAILILNEIIGYIGSEPIYRYHLCNNWAYSYWKARAYLTACVAIAWKKNIYVRGTITANKFINKLTQGQIILACKREGVESLFGKRCYAEDMALLPKVFLKDLNPESHNFGLVSGLDLWLQLDEQGLMDTGLGKSATFLFTEERAKYLSN